MVVEKVQGQHQKKKNETCVKKKAKKNAFTRSVFHLQNRKEIILRIIVILLPILLYINTFNHAYVYDDFNVLHENWIVKEGLKGIPVLFQHSYRYAQNIQNDNLYRPMSQVMFAIEWEFWPNNPHINHIINVLLYALVCWLALVVLKLLFPKLQFWIIAATTILFIVHPIHTEVVANIKSRDEILCMLGFLSALIFLMHWFSTRKSIQLVLSMLCYTVALFSKETALALLLIFPLAAYCFDIDKKRLFLLSGMFLIPLSVYLSMRYLALNMAGTVDNITVLDNFLVDSPGFLARFPTVISLLGKYLTLFILPWNLVSDYSFNQLEMATWSDFSFWVALVLHFGILFYVITNFSKRTPLVFGLLFYLISIATYSNLFFLIGSSFAERFLFIPSFGLSISIVFVIGEIFNSGNIKCRPWLNQLRGAGLIVLILLSAKTVVRSTEWKDPLTLSSNDIKRSGNSARLHVMYGFALRDLARTFTSKYKTDSINRLALRSFTRAIEIYPTYATAHAQSGLLNYVLNEPDVALNHYRTALAINPSNAETWCNMGIIYVDRKEYDSAILIYQESIRRNPRFIESYLNLGSLIGQKGMYNEALPYFKEVLEYDPENMKAMQMISLTYSLLGKKPLADYWKNQMISVQSKYTP